MTRIESSWFLKHVQEFQYSLQAWIKIKLFHKSSQVWTKLKVHGFICDMSI